MADSRRLHLSDEMIRLLFVLALTAIISIRNPAFLTYTNAIDVLNEASVLSIIASGMMLVMVTGGIDISVGASLGLSGMICALASRDNPSMPVLIIMAVGILSGLAVGMVNGLIVARFRVIPLIATLGTMNISRAMIYLVSGGDWVSTYQLSPEYVSFATSKVLGITSLIYIMLGVSIVMFIYTTYFRSARNMVLHGKLRDSSQATGRAR